MTGQVVNKGQEVSRNLRGPVEERVWESARGRPSSVRREHLGTTWTLLFLSRCQADIEGREMKGEEGRWREEGREEWC